MSDNIYFANKEGDELLACLDNKKQNFYNYVRSSGLFNLWETAHNQYYKASVLIEPEWN